MEELLVEKIIFKIWRWRRLLKIESQTFDKDDMFDSSWGPVRAFEVDNERSMQTLIQV